MEYHQLLSVTGKSGLFELVSSKTDGAILRSLQDKTTQFISNRLHQFSHLESIEVYTERENVNLVEVFQAMEKASQPLPPENDPKAVKAYFEQVFPAMDFARVYDSDRKKMVKWFALLKNNGVALQLSPDTDPEAAA